MFDMPSKQKRLLTGLQPSAATLHIGNYFGAMKPFVDLYQEYESFIMVADYHALTSMRDGDLLRANTINLVKDYLAVGLDPEKVVLFKQSDVPEHTELAWIFECLVTVPFLMQAHAYKDKTGKGMEATAGLFNYPMLMAADILLYEADVVPVGEDQRQHIEYTREAANKFNLAYGEIFTMPTEHIVKGVGVVPGTDGQKMSKSYKNTIPLFGSKEEVEKAVMSIVTDSDGERPENVFAIHSLIKPKEELEPVYEEHKSKYGDLKKLLVADLEAVLQPLREARAKISDDMVYAVLASGAEKAKQQAKEKMEVVRSKVGIL